ncbi:MAG: hypothetical protein C0467_23290 [Planctomycetaceae bacterium]|nr:hypothetical protein [Planctomycetaceae bacterium]
MSTELTPRDFVLAWESSQSLKEVAEKTGIKASIAAARASLYRSRGINLKKFKQGRKPQDSVEELNKLIEEMGGTPASTVTVKTPAQKADKTPEQLREEAAAQAKKIADKLAAILGNKKSRS